MQGWSVQHIVRNVALLWCNAKTRYSYHNIVCDRMYNNMKFNFGHNPKQLLKSFDPFVILPKTFHILLKRNVNLCSEILTRTLNLRTSFVRAHYLDNVSWLFFIPQSLYKYFPQRPLTWENNFELVNILT